MNYIFQKLNMILPKQIDDTGTGTAGRGSVGNFSFSICLSWSPGAYGGMVLGAVRAWLLGRAVANRLTQYCKQEV